MRVVHAVVFLYIVVLLVEFDTPGRGIEVGILGMKDFSEWTIPYPLLHPGLMWYVQSLY